MQSRIIITIKKCTARTLHISDNDNSSINYNDISTDDCCLWKTKLILLCCGTSCLRTYNLLEIKLKVDY